ncbi:Uncharacterised protein [uncultured archaeon]|nr:Uncharacterised protein [uncultured archaeon]
MRKLVLAVLSIAFATSTASADLIGDLGKTLVEAVYTPAYNAVYALLTAFMQLVLDILVWNPPLDSAYDAWSIVRTVITSMYLVVLTYAGLKLMAGTMVGENERSTLKKWVGGSILSLLLVNMSYVLYESVIQLNVGLSALVYKQPNIQGFIAASAAFIILLSLQTSIVMLVILLLIVRTLLVLVGVVLFPIGIFLYYLPPTRRFGKLIITVIFANIFIQFFEVLCLRVCLDMFGAIGGSFTSSVFNTMFGMAMMLLMLFVPLVSYGFATLTGMILQKATEVVTNVVPMPVHLDTFRTRGKQ